MDVPQHHLHPLLEAHLGLPAQLGDDLADIRERAVRLPRTLGHVDYPAAEELDKLVDRPRISCAHVESVPGVLRSRRRQKRLRYIGHIHEIATLGAVADDRERLARKLLAQE